MTTELLPDRLAAAGLRPVDVRPTDEGLAAVSGLVTLADRRQVFAKTFAQRPEGDVFADEAEGIEVLHAAGLATPDVLHCGDDLLVLSLLQPRPDTEQFWGQLAHDLARVHQATVTDRFGWPHDNWLGPMRQHNAWHHDGFAFFAERRVLRWLPERRVAAKLDATERDALERLCAALPDLMATRPACLTHGDFWKQNILATADGRPAVIDPAVSYMWTDNEQSASGRQQPRDPHEALPVDYGHGSGREVDEVRFVEVDGYFGQPHRARSPATARNSMIL